MKRASPEIESGMLWKEIFREVSLKVEEEGIDCIRTKSKILECGSKTCTPLSIVNTVLGQRET